MNCHILPLPYSLLNSSFHDQSTRQAVNSYRDNND